MSASSADALQAMRASIKRGGIDLMAAFRAFDKYVMLFSYFPFSITPHANKKNKHQAHSSLNNTPSDLSLLPSLRLGRVDFFRVRPILGTSGVPMPSAEALDAIMADYKHPADKTKFDYYRFVKELEDVPSFHAAVPAPRAFTATAAAALPAKVLAQTEATLARLQAVVARLRMDITIFFQAHDRFRNGTCPPPKFGSVLTSCGLVVSAAELAALLQRFHVSETATDYKSFLALITAPPASQDRDRYGGDGADTSGPASLSASFSPAKQSMSRTSAPPRSTFDQPVAVATDVLTVLRKAHALFSAARVQLDPCANYFRDHDPLNRGAVETGVFARVLSSAYALALSPREIAVLTEQYLLTPPGASPAFVDYRAFVADVAIATAGGDVFALERAPTRDLTAPAPAWSPHEENAASFDGSTDAGSGSGSAGGGAGAGRVQELLAALAVAGFARRLELEPSFTDRDPLRKGCVNARQFQTVISEIPAAGAFLARDWAALLAAYQKGALGHDYRAFLGDLRAQQRRVQEGHQEVVARAQAQGLSSYELPPSAALTHARQTMGVRELGGATAVGSGAAPRAAGTAAIKGYGPVVGGSTPGARAHDPFPSNIKNATLPRGAGGVYGSGGAERVEVAGVPEGAAGGLFSSMAVGEDLGSALAARTDAVVRKVRALVASRRVPLRTHLAAGDRAGSGLVDLNVVWQALANNGVAVSQEELELLALRYEQPGAGKSFQQGGSGARIAYAQLCDDVQSA